MIIEGNVEQNTLRIRAEGKIDMATAPELDKFLNENLRNVQLVDIDFKDISYISSAGLRVLLHLNKLLGGKKESIILRNIRDNVLSVLDLTGFTDMVTIY